MATKFPSRDNVKFSSINVDTEINVVQDTEALSGKTSVVLGDQVRTIIDLRTAPLSEMQDRHMQVFINNIKQYGLIEMDLSDLGMFKPINDTMEELKFKFGTALNNYVSANIGQNYIDVISNTALPLPVATGSFIQLKDNTGTIDPTLYLITDLENLELGYRLHLNKSINQNYVSQPETYNIRNDAYTFNTETTYEYDAQAEANSYANTYIFHTGNLGTGNVPLFEYSTDGSETYSYTGQTTDTFIFDSINYEYDTNVTYTEYSFTPTASAAYSTWTPGTGDIWNIQSTEVGTNDVTVELDSIDGLEVGDYLSLNNTTNPDNVHLVTGVNTGESPTPIEFYNYFAETNSNGQISNDQTLYPGGSSVYTTTSNNQADGGTSSLSVQANDTFNQPGAFTYEAWFYLPSFDNSKRRFPLVLGRNYGVHTIMGGNGMVAYDNTGSSEFLTSSPITHTDSAFSFTNTSLHNKWIHFAWQRDTDNNLQVLLNGSTWNLGVQNTPIPSDSLSVNEFIPEGEINNHGRMECYISDVRLSNTARYAIADPDANSTYTVPTAPFELDSNTLYLSNDTCSGNSCPFSYYNSTGFVGTATPLNNVTTSLVDGQFGAGALHIENRNQGVQPAGDYSIGASDDFTFEARVRLGNVTQSQSIMTLGSNETNRFSLYVDGATSQLRFVRSGVSEITTNLMPTADTWHHVAVTRESGTMRIFLDGVEGTISSFNSADYLNVALGNTGLLTIGRFYNNDDAAQGYIDEVRVSNTARYTAAFTPPTLPFVTDVNTRLYMPFNVNPNYREEFVWIGNDVRFETGNLPGDSSGAIDGRYYRTANDDAPGNSNRTDSILRSNRDYTLGTGDFTIEWYHKKTGGNGIQQIFTIGDEANAPIGRATAYFNSNDNLSFNIQYGNGQYENIGDITGNLAAFQWHHIAIVRESGTFRVYTNGTQTHTSTPAARSIGGTNPILDLGGFANGNQTAAVNGFIGGIDLFQISNVARYNANFTPATTLRELDANTLFRADFNLDGQGAVAAANRDPVTITEFGTPEIATPGRFDDNSLLLNADGDYIRIDDALNTLTNVSDPFTVEFWYQPTSVPTNFIANVGINTQAGGGNSLLIGHTSNNGIYFNIDSVDLIPSSGLKINYSVGTWYHVAVTYDGSDARLFVNGTERRSTGGSEGEPNQPLSDNVFGIGTEFDAANGGVAGNYASGYYDDFRVSNIARYTSNFDVPTESLTNDNNTLFLFTGRSGEIEDDTTGGGATFRTTITDISTNGTVEVEARDADDSEDLFGNNIISMGNAVSGVSSVSAMSGIDAGAESFTVETFVKLTNLVGGYRQIMGVEQNNNVYGSTLWYNDSSDQFGLGINDAFSPGLSGPTGLLDVDVWSHVVLVHDQAAGMTRILVGPLGGTLTEIITAGGLVSEANAVYAIFGEGDPQGGGGTLYNTNADYDNMRISKGIKYVSGDLVPTTNLVNDEDTVLLINGENSNAGDTTVLDNPDTAAATEPTITPASIVVDSTPPNTWQAGTTNLQRVEGFSGYIIDSIDNDTNTVTLTYPQADLATTLPAGAILSNSTSNNDGLATVVSVPNNNTIVFDDVPASWTSNIELFVATVTPMSSDIIITNRISDTQLELNSVEPFANGDFFTIDSEANKFNAGSEINVDSSTNTITVTEGAFPVTFVANESVARRTGTIDAGYDVVSATGTTVVLLGTNTDGRNGNDLLVNGDYLGTTTTDDNPFRIISDATEVSGNYQYQVNVPSGRTIDQLTGTVYRAIGANQTITITNISDDRLTITLDVDNIEELYNVMPGDLLGTGTANDADYVIIDSIMMNGTVIECRNPAPASFINGTNLQIVTKATDNSMTVIDKNDATNLLTLDTLTNPTGINLKVGDYIVTNKDDTSVEGNKVTAISGNDITLASDISSINILDELFVVSVSLVSNQNQIIYDIEGSNVGNTVTIEGPRNSTFGLTSGNVISEDRDNRIDPEQLNIVSLNSTLNQVTLLNTTQAASLADGDMVSTFTTADNSYTVVSTTTNSITLDTVINLQVNDILAKGNDYVTITAVDKDTNTVTTQQGVPGTFFADEVLELVKDILPGMYSGTVADFNIASQLVTVTDVSDLNNGDYVSDNPVATEAGVVISNVDSDANTFLVPANSFNVGNITLYKRTDIDLATFTIQSINAEISPQTITLDDTTGITTGRLLGLQNTDGTFSVVEVNSDPVNDIVSISPTTPIPADWDIGTVLFEVETVIPAGYIIQSNGIDRNSGTITLDSVVGLEVMDQLSETETGAILVVTAINGNTITVSGNIDASIEEGDMLFIVTGTVDAQDACIQHNNLVGRFRFDGGDVGSRAELLTADGTQRISYRFVLREEV